MRDLDRIVNPGNKKKELNIIKSYIPLTAITSLRSLS